MLRALYNWIIALSAHPRAPAALGAVSFAESSFFPIPPDAMLIPMCLARPDRAYHYAFICTVTSVIGGLLGYAIGTYLFEAVALPVLAAYGHADALQTFDPAVGVYVDDVYYSRIRGTQFDLLDLERPAAVEFFADGTPIGSAAADLPHPVLTSAEYRHGRCGFRFPLPSEIGRTRDLVWGRSVARAIRPGGGRFVARPGLGKGSAPPGSAHRGLVDGAVGHPVTARGALAGVGLLLLAELLGVGLGEDGVEAGVLALEEGGAHQQVAEGGVPGGDAGLGRLLGGVGRQAESLAVDGVQPGAEVDVVGEAEAGDDVGGDQGQPGLLRGRDDGVIAHGAVVSDQHQTGSKRVDLLDPGQGLHDGEVTRAGHAAAFDGAVLGAEELGRGGHG